LLLAKVRRKKGTKKVVVLLRWEGDEESRGETKGKGRERKGEMAAEATDRLAAQKAVPRVTKQLHSHGRHR